MQETWRWYGPNDSVSLTNILQSGASGVVTSLHHIPTGEVWPLDEILKRKACIEKQGLDWSVIESIPLHNDIKTRSKDYAHYIENYKQSLINVGKAGLKTVCYNFMPVVDWTRTNLLYDLPNKSKALRFEMSDFAAYDVYYLKRDNAEKDYQADTLVKAKCRFDNMSELEKELLENNIIAGLPGGEGSYDRQGLLAAITEFIQLGTDRFREILFEFLRDIIPVAEEAGVNMCIHPDDPPFSLFGLPRVVSTASDVRALLDVVPSISNGLTLCAGSFGVRADNNLVGMVKEFGSKIHFVHLRNVTRDVDGSFCESEHLDGDNDMVGLIQALLAEEQQRQDLGKERCHIAMRPDHGHLLGDEIGKSNINPGYSFGGRMKGLAENRGVIHAIDTLNNRGVIDS